LLLNANKAGFDDIQQYLEQENRDEAQRIQNEIQKIDRFMERQRRAAQIEEERIDRELQELRNQLGKLEGVKSKWQTPSRRERKLAIQQSIRDLVERRTELTQEMEGSLEDLFIEKIELERELDEVRGSNAYNLL